MTSVRFLAPDTDAFVDSVLRHADEFESATGLQLEPQIIPSDEYFSNDIHGYLTASEPPDVYMSGPVLLWEHIGAGLVEPLDRFVDGADAFDISDFFDSLVRSNRWTGRFGDPLGHGSLWEVPVNCEAYNLAYLPQALERHDLPVPTTWSEYFATATKLQQRSGGQQRGFAQRGIQVWHTMYTGYASQFWAYGGRDFDDAGRCAISASEGVAATSDFIEALRAAGPPSWLDQRWYELAMDFCAGSYGMIVDSDHYVAFYEAPESAVRGQVAYAPTPAGPDGRRVSSMWTWSLVMNARSVYKDRAWRFMEWASSSPFLLRAAFEGNMNPTRRSIWDDERFADLAAGWGAFPSVARGLIEHDARVLVTPASNYLQIGDRWVQGIRAAYSGEITVAEALEAAARDIDELVAGAR